MRTTLLVFLALIVLVSGCISNQAEKSPEERFEDLVSQQEKTSYKISYTGQDGSAGSILGQPNTDIINQQGVKKVNPNINTTGLTGLQANITYYSKDNLTIMCRDLIYEGNKAYFCKEGDYNYLSYPAKYIEIAKRNNLSEQGTKYIKTRRCQSFQYYQRISDVEERNVSLCIDEEKGFVSRISVKTTTGGLSSNITYQLDSYEEVDNQGDGLPVNAILRTNYTITGEEIYRVVRIGDTSTATITAKNETTQVEFGPDEQSKTLNSTWIREIDAGEITLYAGKITQTYTLLN